MKRALSRTLLLACMLLVAAAAGAAVTRPVAPKRAAPQARVAKTAHAKHVAHAAVKPAAAGTAGMRIFRDPDTGEIGPPTAENAAAIARENPPVDVTSLPQVALPRGGFELLIDGKIEDAIVVQKDANGRLVTRCVQDAHAAHQQPTVVAPAPQREDR